MENEKMEKYKDLMFMREALLFYANPETWQRRINRNGAIECDAEDDYGRCAHAALWNAGYDEEKNTNEEPKLLSIADLRCQMLKNERNEARKLAGTMRTWFRGYALAHTCEYGAIRSGTSCEACEFIVAVPDEWELLE